MKTLSFNILILIFVGSCAFAQEAQPTRVPYELAPGYVKFVNLDVDDQISGNCWSNTKTVEAKVRLLLEQNELPVLNYLPQFRSRFVPQVTILGLGMRNGNGTCFGHIQFLVQTIYFDKYGGFEGKEEFEFTGFGTVFSQASIFSNAGNLNAQISDFVEGAASEFAAEAISSRRNELVSKFNKLYPGFDQKPMSREEFDKIIEEAMQNFEPND